MRYANPFSFIFISSFYQLAFPSMSFLFSKGFLILNLFSLSKQGTNLTFSLLDWS
jgi:hypothetical protein